jgi:hypothetical protein
MSTSVERAGEQSGQTGRSLRRVGRHWSHLVDSAVVGESQCGLRSAAGLWWLLLRRRLAIRLIHARSLRQHRVCSYMARTVGLRRVASKTSEFGTFNGYLTVLRPSAGHTDHRNRFLRQNWVWNRPNGIRTRQNHTMPQNVRFTYWRWLGDLRYRPFDPERVVRTTE